MAFISSGTTIIDNGAFQASLGSQVLIKEITASADATISFVDGTDGVVLDSTYPIYKFEFINMHPATNQVLFSFNVSIDSGSNYNVAKTTTTFEAYHFENDSDSALVYQAGDDLAQGTGFQELSDGIGNGNDECNVGTLTLFNPSSTTFVKHFISTTNMYNGGDLPVNDFIAGYANTTSAVNAVRFQMSSGNIDSGTIKLYGIKDS